jgi:hypothetical protein
MASSADHRITEEGAAAEGQAPRVPGGLEVVEEEALLVGVGAADPEVVLDGVGVEEVLRRLHQADRRVVEQRQRPVEEVPVRHEVGVEHRDEVGRLRQGPQHAEGGVDVARLGVGVVGARQVAGAESGAEGAQPGPPRVVQHPDPGVRVAHRERADDGALEDGLLLVVGGDQEVHHRRGAGAPPPGVAVGLGPAVPRAGQQQEGEGGRGHGPGLQQREGPARDRVDREAGRRYRFGEAPSHVADGQEEGGAEQRRADQRVPAPAEGQHDQREPDHQQGRGEGRGVVAEQQH